MARYRRNSESRRNFDADARKINDKAFKHEYRDTEQYRDERLDTERERLERRLAWAFRREDVAGVKRLQRRLDELCDDALTDIAPGKTPGRLERWKLDFTN